MKNGEAILSALKLLGKELSIGLKEESKVLRGVAEKVVDSYKDGTLAEKAKQEITKDAAIAGEFISAQVETIGTEIKKAKAQVEQKRQAQQAAKVENTAEENSVEVEAEAEIVFDAEPVVYDNFQIKNEPEIVEVPAEESAAKD